MDRPRPAPAEAAEVPACRPGSSLSPAEGASSTGLKRLGDRPWLDSPGGEYPMLGSSVWSAGSTDMVGAEVTEKLKSAARLLRLPGN